MIFIAFFNIEMAILFFNKTKIAPYIGTDNITEKTASLLEQINNYTPEPNKYEKILPTIPPNA